MGGGAAVMVMVTVADWPLTPSETAEMLTVPPAGTLVGAV